MPRPWFELVWRSWPVAVLGIPFGGVYFALMHFLPDAIEAGEQISHRGPGGEGPEMLFVLNSLFLGWVTVVALERRLGLTGRTLFALAIPCWTVAIGGGFALAASFSQSLPTATPSYIALCIVSVTGTGALRIYFSP